MKLIDDDEKGKEVFKPFDMTLRFETKGEARLMWHVFNRNNLWPAIEACYCGGYITPDKSFGGPTDNEVKAFIERYVSIEE